MQSTKYPIELKDQLGNFHKFDEAPKRIISLVPSITLTLFDLGLDQTVVGRTKFCIHPSSKVKSVTKIGGTKKLNLNEIHKLKPDLIIANKEENEKEQIEALQSAEEKVWITDVNDLADNYEMILQLGKITNTINTAKSIINETKAAFNILKKLELQSVAYFIWRQPFMVAGNNTFINALLNKMQLKNVFENYDERYPIISEEHLVKEQPSIIFLSSEPYPFNESHIEELKAICPNAKIVLVDGELFSWHGSKIRYTPRYFNQLYEAITS